MDLTIAAMSVVMTSFSVHNLDARWRPL